VFFSVGNSREVRYIALLTIYQKSNIKFDAVAFRQTLTKCSKIKQASAVLCAE